MGSPATRVEEGRARVPNRNLWDYQRELDRHAKAILERAMADREMNEAIQEGIEAIRRGDNEIPYRQVREEARRRRAGA